MKKVRHKKIIEIIEKQNVETQEELAACLREEGFAVTQATVSRDIRELKLSKVSAGGGRQKYVALKQTDRCCPLILALLVPMYIMIRPLSITAELSAGFQSTS